MNIHHIGGLTILKTRNAAETNHRTHAGQSEATLEHFADCCHIDQHARILHLSTRDIARSRCFPSPRRLLPTQDRRIRLCGRECKPTKTLMTEPFVPEAERDKLAPAWVK